MNVESKKKLIEIFAFIFELDNLDDVENMRQISTRKWDSIAIASLVVAVESEFVIEITNEEYSEFTSFNQINAIIQEKISA